MDIPEDIKNQMMEAVRVFFGTDSDPSQLQSSDTIRDKYFSLHKNVVVYKTDEDGKLMGWVSGFPTTKDDMESFLSGKINEQELFDATEKMDVFEYVYMQVVLVFPEYRKAGLAYSLSSEFIKNFLEENPGCVFYIWEFSNEGKLLANKLENQFGIKIARKL